MSYDDDGTGHCQFCGEALDEDLRCRMCRAASMLEHADEVKQRLKEDGKWNHKDNCPS